MSDEQRAGAERLGAALYAAGYTEPRLRQFWGGPVSDALARNNAAPALRHCRQVLGARHAETGPDVGTDSGNGADSPSGAGEAPGTGAISGAQTTADSIVTPSPAAPSADLSFDERLAALALTFLLHDTLPTALLEAALGAADCAAAFDLGLLADATDPGTRGDRDRDVPAPDGSASFVTAPFAVAPFDLPVGVPRGLRPGDENLYLVSDHGTLTSPDVLDGDFVLGVGGAGRTLVSLTPRDPVALAADIGTGCGIQALLLARHADRVIATDISARALHLTALGAALNGVTGLDLRQGSLLDPIDGTVDLLVSNPPFVITPRGQEADAALPAFDYRDGGMRADRLVRELFAQIPSVLAPGGRAVCLGNWEVTPDSTGGPETWVSSAADGIREPAASHDTATEPAASHDTATAATASHDTSAAAETSVFVVEREILDPVTYAETWIRDGGIPRASAAWNAATSAWLDDFASREVTEIVFGYVLMHRADNDSSSLSPQAIGADQGRTGLAEAGAEPAFRARVRITSAPATNPHGIGAFVQTIHELGAWAESAGDEEIAATAFTRSPDLVEHRHFVPGETDPTSITVEQGIGFGRVIDVDTALAGFLSVADGSLTLRQTAAALAQLLGVDEAALEDQLIAQVRGLVAAGMLLPGGN
nr:class I SAM-dependent methyltransferase [Brevibacterium sp. XM4083]